MSTVTLAAPGTILGAKIGNKQVPLFFHLSIYGLMDNVSIHLSWPQKLRMESLFRKYPISEKAFKEEASECP